MSWSKPQVVRGLRATTRLSPGHLVLGGSSRHEVHVTNYSSATLDVHVEGDCDPAGPLRYGPAGALTPRWRPPPKQAAKPGFLVTPKKFDEDIHLPVGAVVRQREERVDIKVATKIVGKGNALTPLAHWPLSLRCT